MRLKALQANENEGDDIEMTEQQEINNPCILIVDDSRVIRNRVKRVLYNNELSNIHLAENGLECLKLYREVNPDLVILDIILPDMDGIEILEEIFNIDRTAKVIMLSAILSDKNVESAISMGAKACIPKPFDEKSFIQEVNKIISL